MNLDDLLQQFGLPVGMLMIALLTGARGTWVFGRELKASQERETEWRQIALKALNVGERITEKP